MKSIFIGCIAKKFKNHIFFHPIEKCFWYVILTVLMMIYDEWAPHRPIILPQEEQIDQTRCLILRLEVKNKRFNK